MAQQRFPSLTAFSPGATTVVPGHPLGRALGQYGKAYSPPPGMADIGGFGTGSPPSSAGRSAIRGLKGGFGNRIKEGGLGAGRMGFYGSQRSYPKDTT
jgi:hypothetical protein